MAATAKDPGAPLPEGSAMTPAIGAQLVIPAGLPRNLEAAIQRYVFAFSFDFSSFECLDMGQLLTRLQLQQFWIQTGS